MSDAFLCDCDYNEESEIIGDMCKYCKIKNDKLLKSEWHEEIKVIRKYLNTIEYINNYIDKIPILRKLFEYMITRPKFIAKNNGFRLVVISKMNEIKLNEQSDKLSDIFDKFNIFLEDLKNNDDYII
jgi:uncharacterized protein YktA (UPF0223 family)